MTADEPSDGDKARHIIVTRLFRWHLLAYCVVMGILVGINILVGGGWWSFWPMCAWGLVFAFHFFYYKSVTVDDDWVKERTDDMRLRSYDVSHILDIEERVKQGDDSVRRAEERDS